MEPFSLPSGGAQVISSDFATRRWLVATVAVVAAGPPHTRDGSESGAMLSRRQSKQIGNRSPLPACPTTCTASLPPHTAFFQCRVCGLARLCAASVLELYEVDTNSVGKQMGRCGEIIPVPRNLGCSRGHAGVEGLECNTRAMQCFCYGDRGIMDNKTRSQLKTDLATTSWGDEW